MLKAFWRLVVGHRVRALVVKEFAQIRRDRRLVMSLIVPPVLQLTLFGFALSPTVSNLRLGVVDESKDKLKPEIRVSKETPPMFLAQSNNDNVGPENAAVLYLALKKAGVPAELHIFATGGHGYGIRPGKEPYAEWPKRCEEWLRTQKVLKAEK